MYEQYYDKLADLLLFGINAESGDKIRMVIDFDCREVARRVAEKAYRSGARYVALHYRDEFLQAAAIQGTYDDFWFPDYVAAELEETAQPGWKSISIRSQGEGEMFRDLPADRAAAFFRAQRQKQQVHMRAVMSNRIPWTVTVLPSPHLAKQAFPDLSEKEGMQRYWQAIVEIMHLDADDPRTVWHEKMVADEKRSRFLNDLSPKALHFSGPGTDLTVGLNQHARWIGGYDITTSGERFITNLPTEEIFTSPDFRTVEGRVSLTRPFVMHQNLGPIARGAWFEFREGRVVDFGAEEGKETLEAFFAIDERAVYTGEISLVDPHSPIAEQGITYYNALHDENTSCHLAFGKAYPFTLKETGEYSDEELIAMGMNVSSVHEDAMIGGVEVDVTAILPDGSRSDLIRGGKYLIGSSVTESKQSMVDRRKE